MWTIITITIASEGSDMKTVQLTLDDELVHDVDKVVKDLKTTRSAFTREALYAALEQIKIKSSEIKHRTGYAKKPVKHGEFDTWENEQSWGD